MRRPGWDVVVLWRGDPDGSSGHVGLYAGHDGEHVRILGGNQGDEFNERNYSRDRLLGVVRLYEEGDS